MKNRTFNEDYLLDFSNEVDNLNKSKLSLPEYLETVKDSPLSEFLSSNNYSIIDDSFKFSEFYNITFCLYGKNHILTLLRTDKIYNLSCQKASSKSLKILNDHKLEFLKSKLPSNPFIFNFFKDKDIYSSSIDRISTFASDIKYILSVTKNSKLSDYHYANKNIYDQYDIINIFFCTFFFKILDDKDSTIFDIMNHLYDTHERTNAIFLAVSSIAKNIKLNITIKRKLKKNLEYWGVYNKIYSFYDTYNFNQFKKEILEHAHKFEHSFDFENQISLFIDRSFDWDINNLKSKLKKENIFYSEKNNVVTASFETFEQIKKFGSPTWCIVTSNKEFNSICNKEGVRQFITFDFNKKFTEPNSMVGFTTEKNIITKMYNRSNMCILKNNDAVSFSYLNYSLFKKKFLLNKILTFFKIKNN